MGDIKPSRLLGFITQGMKLKSQGVDLCDLGPGQPDVPVPGPIVEATRRALAEGRTAYSPVAGIPQLREAVAARYHRRNGANYQSRNVLVTAGGKGALFHGIGALLSPGEEVLIPVPYFVSFVDIVRIWGGVPKFVDCRGENGFLPLMEELTEASGPNTKGLILNSPVNPSAAVYPLELVEKILQFAASRGMFVIMDECYDRFVYPPAEYATIPDVFPDPDLPFYIAGSFSKTFSMTGFRCGYLVGPEEGVAAATTLQGHSMNGATTFAQHGALEALNREEELFAPIFSLFSRRREVLMKGLSDVPGFEVQGAPGAFYVYPDVRGAMERLGMASSEDLALMLLNEAKVMAIPGAAFGQDGYLRFSYAVEEDVIREALSRIRKAIGSP
jgi:aspartate aminotransferase